MSVRNTEDLSLVYTPGVAEPCRQIAANPEDVYKYTIKGNTVAIVSDGSAVLGLGNIGAAAAIPVMEGKAMLFKRFANIDAFPICLDTQDPEEIVKTIRHIAPVFGGINLEDISAPRSFFIEEALQDLGIPVFHDDQHGTAIVVLAALMNAAAVAKKSIFSLRVVVNGAGAAGIAISKLIRCVGHDNTSCISVKDVILCDSKGIIHNGRQDLNSAKEEMLRHNALVGADVFIGVSKGNLINREDIKVMNKDAIVMALANPTPEIMPEEAKAGGALIVATGRSDMPNQVNNVLGFPGIFRGALDARAPQITAAMKLAAAEAIAGSVRNLSTEMIIPPALNERVAWTVAEAVKKAAMTL
ncbi:UNVERIFIED_CONTAM: hypothetical protein GTU68_041925 [Idotea baltica]|nr:hypothetical protein [Idotea baltica]